MAINSELLERVKVGLRIKHTVLDEDIMDTIEAAFADLKVCGVTDPSEATSLPDPLILNAVKLFCKAAYTDDLTKAAAYMERYDRLKACLMMAEGYGWHESEGAE